MLDSSVYGAAVEDEGSYEPDTHRYWDTVYSKALLRMRKLEIFGCPPVEEELSEAPEPIRKKLLALYTASRPLKAIAIVSELSNRYTKIGIFL